MFVIILLTNCKEENIFVPDTGRKIVINGLLTTNSYLNISLSRSSFVNDISESAVISSTDLEGASVFFYQNNNYIDSLYHDKREYYVQAVFYKGNYWSKKNHPLPGNKYDITVKAPGLPDASASTIIPNLVKIERFDTAQVIISSLSGQNEKGLKCEIEFTDPDHERNYYLFNIAKVPNYDHFSENIGFDCQDPIIEEKLNTGISQEGIAFTDNVINGQKHVITIILNGSDIGYPFFSNSSGDLKLNKGTIYFRLYSITEEYYTYIKTLNLYNTNYSNPIAEPVLMFSNVIGGYGVFSSAAVSSDSIVYYY
jgi:hypothetical protein